jgi:hypothetical protein
MAEEVRPDNSLSYELESKKAKVERTVGLFQTILLASALRAGAPCGRVKTLFSGPGRLSYSFCPSHTNYEHGWSSSANRFHSSA